MKLGKQTSKIFLLIFLALVTFEKGNCQTYGVFFSGPEVSKDSRTGLDLTQFKTFNFNDGFTLSFEIMFRSLEFKHYGFITRIIANNSENIDLIYDNQEGTNKLVLVAGNKLNPIPYPVSKMQNEWTKIGLTYLPENNLCELSIGDSVYRISTLKFRSGKHFKIFFGAVPKGLFETSDVPAMNLKDVQIYEDDELVYDWPLNEKDGEFATDQIHNLKAKVYHPIWLSKKHNNWELIKSFKVSGDAAITYNHINNDLVIASEQGLKYFNIQDRSISEIIYRNKPPAIITSAGNIFVDDSTGIVYCFDIKHKTISSFNSEKSTWSNTGQFVNTGDQPYFINKVYSTTNKKLYVFEGFFDNKYQNRWIEFDLNSQKWTTIKTVGDSIAPRYLCGIGLNASTNTLSLAGGYGSDSGNPILNSHYYYELFTLNLKDSQQKKNTQYSSDIHNFAFANSLVIDEKENAILGLSYSAHKFKSNLQLIQSVKGHSEWTEMGDKIPYLFQKNHSYADLFYSKKFQKLVAVTIFKDKNDQSSVDVYTLYYPPNKSVQIVTNEVNTKKAWYWIIIILLFDLSLFLGFLIKKRISNRLRSKRLEKEAEKRKVLEATIHALADSEKPKSSIFLFGGFQAFDQKGDDITKLFTPLLKELFLIILLYPFKNGKGVTSKKLTEMLWFDKPAEKAVNNRSVNMGKLKKILSLIGSSDLSNSNGYWTFTFNEGFPKMYVDLMDFQQITQYEKIEKEDIQRLIKIVQKGSLLTFLTYDWLDEIKERISSRIIDLFVEYLEDNRADENAEETIKLADCILIFDSINEQAIAFKCKALINIGQHGVAQKTFQKFITEYKQLYAVPFEKSLKDIINQDRNSF